MDNSSKEHFQTIISDRFKAIASELKDLEQSTGAISPDVSIGRLSRLDSMQHQQIALANKRRCEEERGRLQEAERRLNAGTFGTCLRCGNVIAVERLEIQPDAVTCVPCAQR